MGGHTTMKRDGGWTIELMVPIEGINQLDIRPPSLRHTIRWTSQQIPSVLALLAELTGVSEEKLKGLAGPDTDRVLSAFAFIVPPIINDDFKTGKRPLATPPDLMSEQQQYEVLAGENDPEDPRFPRMPGSVQRYQGEELPEPQSEPEPEPPPPDRGGMDMKSPEIMRRVS